MHYLVVLSYCIGVAAAQTGANCDVPCDSYATELSNANYQDSQDVYNVGGAFDDPADTIEAVCNISGDDIQTCFVCSKDGQGLSNDPPHLMLLDAWWQTCATFQKQGVSNAYACWLSIPGGSGQCAYVVSGSGAPQSTTLTTTASPTSASSANISPNSATSTSISKTSITSSSSSSANSALKQQVIRHEIIVGGILARLLHLVL